MSLGEHLIYIPAGSPADPLTGMLLAVAMRAAPVYVAVQQQDHNKDLGASRFTTSAGLRSGQSPAPWVFRRDDC